MNRSFAIRQATQQDSAVIARQRRLMFADGRQYSDIELTHMESLYQVWVQAKLATGEYLGWLAEDGPDDIVAGVGLWLREWPPILNNDTGRQGYLENVFTLPGYRRRGIARQLMNVLLAWVRASQAVYEIQLHPTHRARSLYSSLGFEDNCGSMCQWFGPVHHHR